MSIQIDFTFPTLISYHRTDKETLLVVMNDTNLNQASRLLQLSTLQTRNYTIPRQFGENADVVAMGSSVEVTAKALIVSVII